MQDHNHLQNTRVTSRNCIIVLSRARAATLTVDVPCYGTSSSTSCCACSRHGPTYLFLSNVRANPITNLAPMQGRRSSSAHRHRPSSLWTGACEFDVCLCFCADTNITDLAINAAKIVCCIAAQLTGIIFVPTNPTFAAARLSYIYNSCRRVVHVSLALACCESERNMTTPG
jgi:hypothetical protein